MSPRPPAYHFHTFTCTIGHKIDLFCFINTESMTFVTRSSLYSFNTELLVGNFTPQVKTLELIAYEYFMIMILTLKQRIPSVEVPLEN